MSAGLRVAPLGASERDAATRVLARAFRDNPLNRAVIRSEDPARRMLCNESGTAMLLPVAQRHGEVLAVRDGDQIVGAVIATLPWGYPLPAPTFAVRLRALWVQGFAVSQRWGEVFEALDLHHPTQPHRYVSTLGVDPDRQRRGAGSLLLARLLEGADEAGDAVYLETDRPENIAFYERQGFTVLGETEALGVTLWRMQREARGG